MQKKQLIFVVFSEHFLLLNEWLCWWLSSTQWLLWRSCWRAVVALTIMLRNFANLICPIWLPLLIDRNTVFHFYKLVYWFSEILDLRFLKFFSQLLLCSPVAHFVKCSWRVAHFAIILDLIPVIRFDNYRCSISVIFPYAQYFAF